MKKNIWLGLFCLFTLHTTAQEIYTLPEALSTRVSTLENLNGEKGKGGMTNHGAKGNACTALRTGEQLSLLDVTGPGMIRRMWITFNDRSPEVLRGLRLRIYWDGQTVPAVDVPFGDFFCLPLGQQVAFENALFSTAEGRSFNCYISMPFKTGAKVILDNQSGKDLPLLFFDVDFSRQQPEKDQLYFHANWSRQPASVGNDINLLPKTLGKGKFLGTSIGLNVNPDYGQTWWGEGEVKMFLDGDTDYPTICGTGAEDYVGTGWTEGFFVNRYQGCLLADEKKGQYSFYRFHIPDPVVFYQDCKVTLQQIGGGAAAQVKAIKAAGTPIKPLTRYTGRTIRLLEGSDPEADLANAADNDWINFYRKDDYAVTTYYYLDKP